MHGVGGFRIPADHPCLPGHFPGAPLVPGVLLLDMALALIAEEFPEMVLAGVASVKFFVPVLPEHEVTVSRAIPAGDGVRFACQCAGAVCIQGTAIMRPRA